MKRIIKFEITKYGYKATAAGLTFHLREVNRPDEPACYVVYSKDWDENFCGSLIEATKWLTEIIKSEREEA